MPPLPTYANGGEGIATVSRLADPDAAFRALIAAHRGLSDADSAALNARLVLLLANHIGDVGVLRAALRVARSKNSEPAGGGDGLV